MALDVSKNNYKIGIPFLFLSALFIILPVLSWGLKINHYNYFIAMVGLWGVFHFITSRKKTWGFHPMDIWVIVFVAYQIFHVSFLGNASFFEISFWWRFSFIILYFIFKDLLLNYQNGFKKRLVYVLLIRFGVEVFIGALQYLELITISSSKHFDVAGTFSSTNHFALCLGMGLVTLLLQLKKNMPHKLYYLVAVVFGVSGLLLILHSTSRSALLGLLAVAVTYVLLKKNLITTFKALGKTLKLSFVALSIVIIGLGGYALFHLKKDSANGRLFAAKITLSETIKKPVFGHGLFNFEEGYNTAKSKYFTTKTRDWTEIKIGDHITHAMNDYLETLYEIGLVGFVLSLLILIQLFKRITSYDTYVYCGVFIVVICLVAGAFTTLLVNAFFVMTVLMALFLIPVDYLDATSKKVYRYKPLLLLTALVFITIGGLKIYGFYWLESQQSNTTKTVKSSDWEFWTKIVADNGHAQFVYASELHKTYNQKTRALRVMEQAVMKNKKPDNIRKLALYYAHSGNLKKAEDLLRFNIGNEPFLFEPRHDLAVIYQKTGQHKKYIQILKTIIDFPEKVPSKKVTELKNDAKKRLDEALKKK